MTSAADQIEVSNSTSALRGTLEDFSPAEILGLLEGTRQTGALEVSGDCTGALYLDDGAIYYGETDNSPPLHESIVRRGLATEPGWVMANEQVAGGKASLADALVAQGSCSHAALQQLVTDRLIDAMFELLVSAKSNFEFIPGERHPLIGSPVHSVAYLLEEGHKRLERWREVAAVIPSTAVVVRIASELPSNVTSLTLDPDEFRVLAVVDGRRTVADITGVLGASALFVCGTLHRLVTVGACTVVQ